jgi:hypothetical protein
MREGGVQERVGRRRVTDSWQVHCDEGKQCGKPLLSLSGEMCKKMVSGVSLLW